MTPEQSALVFKFISRYGGVIAVDPAYFDQIVSQIDLNVLRALQSLSPQQLDRIWDAANPVRTIPVVPLTDDELRTRQIEEEAREVLRRGDELVDDSPPGRRYRW